MQVQVEGHTKAAKVGNVAELDIAASVKLVFPTWLAVAVAVLAVVFSIWVLW